jgi:hypothetical protein
MKTRQVVVIALLILVITAWMYFFEMNTLNPVIVDTQRPTITWEAEYRDIRSILACGIVSGNDFSTSYIIDSQEKLNDLGCYYTSDESIDFWEGLVIRETFVHGWCPEYFPKFELESDRLVHSIIVTSDSCEAIVIETMLYFISYEVIWDRDIIIDGIINSM